MLSCRQLWRHGWVCVSGKNNGLGQRTPAPYTRFWATLCLVCISTRSRILDPLKIWSQWSRTRRKNDLVKGLGQCFSAVCVHFNLLKCSPYMHNICTGNTQIESLTMCPRSQNSQLNTVSFVGTLLSQTGCCRESRKMWVLSKRDVCTEHPCYDRHRASSWYSQLLYLTSHFLLKPIYYMTYEACVHILRDEDTGSSPSACKVQVGQKHWLPIIQPMVSVSHSITMLFIS